MTGSYWKRSCPPNPTRPPLPKTHLRHGARKLLPTTNRPLRGIIVVSSQNDNDRFDQSRNVLLNETTLLIFLERRQGGRRGPTEDEATRDQATPPNRTSLGRQDQPEASR